jgi:hypothetical protein
MQRFLDGLTAWYLLCWSGVVEEWRFRIFNL